MMSTKQLIRTMPSRDLIKTINKIRVEKANPHIYGKHGTTRWVTESEFWSGHHQDLKAELDRRKSMGKISSAAAIPIVKASHWIQRL